MDLVGKNVVIVGQGESGLAMARWLSRVGARITVVDSREQPPNQSIFARDFPQHRLISGSFTSTAAQAAFAAAELIALSPGVSRLEPVIAQAVAKGIALVSEIELFAWALADLHPAAEVIAVTGSNGKTTTTALILYLLKQAGVPARAAGNISPSALDALMQAVDTQNLPEVWVLELSSFQLETTSSLKPAVAVILNFSQDHLDRYANYDEYIAAKARILLNTRLQVLNRDDNRVWDLRFGNKEARTVSFGVGEPARNGDYGLQGDMLARCSKEGIERLISLSELKNLAGLHNVQNAMAALAAIEGIGISTQYVALDLPSFEGLAHRMQRIATIDGIEFIDDSKGTNVGATLAAITGLNKPVGIILGGDGKGQDFTPLGSALAQHARAIAFIGRDAQIIERALTKAGGAELTEANIPRRHFTELPQAVRWLAEMCRSGDAILLSPACASFDMFTDYRHRGAVFSAAATEIARGKT